jgi:hypothetical protein
MRGHVHMGSRGWSVVLVVLLTVSAAVGSGCGSAGALALEDWQRDLLAGIMGLAPGVIPIPVAGPVGAEGPAGPAGADGVPGPSIIIARAVINADATIENADHVTAVAHPAAGQYQLTIDVTGQILPAGTTEDDFEVFVTMKETSPLAFAPNYVPVSLVGTNLRIDVVLINTGGDAEDHGFSIEVLLPAG